MSGTGIRSAGLQNDDALFAGVGTARPHNSVVTHVGTSCPHPCSSFSSSSPHPAQTSLMHRWRRQGLAGVFGWLICVLLLAFGLAQSAQAAVSPADFDAANQLYEQGKFAEAAAAYEKLAVSGTTSPALLFNQGNAWFKAGRIGQAIAAYHQANRLAPRDPDLRANLRFARNQVQGPTLVPNRWQQWLMALTLNEWTGLASGTAWLVFLLLIASQLRPAWRAGLRLWLWLLTAACLAFSCCLGLAFQQDRGVTRAVVITNGSAVKLGPLEESSVSFTANDGAEVLIVDQKDQWLRIQVGERHAGWIPRDRLAVLSR